MTLFRTGDPRPIHLMGIAGAGMSALALIARHRGVAITGCDTDTSGSGAADLGAPALGVRIWRGHDPSHLDGARAVVVSAAVPPNHPELERARALNLPVVRRADALAQLVGGEGGSLLAGLRAPRQKTTTGVGAEGLPAAPRKPTGPPRRPVAGCG